ncbi:MULTISPECIES: hypothetical protein [unclassified Variovorax]|uniref:hypothetical protein n=1 Tax=unclassified Variovorax TaxID=663243 RepID=UPI00076D5DB5|nr:MULTISPECIES: hypothetical protein [unclassified Variovorax]KWT64513.1 hypothetical protein APY03_7691 [Variovorax sp. WDL1]PNG56386.1 hypothetical protein CHC07_02803 [Variovorax sp. B4]PNG57810.1 hypothetical protein CHC06_02806 [Variovorax sp. B2]VTV09749.1 hypothetical protein WDL1CHR_00822 [Variovorax sp. WDL1]
MSDFSLHPERGPILSSTRPPSARRGSPGVQLSAREHQYRVMEHAFRASGGIARSDEVTARLSRRTDQPISVLARWIVSHDVLSFRWQSRTMLPLFQFDAHTMTLRPPVVDVIRELVPVLGDWEAALWFACPNGWLDNAAPVDVIGPDARAVHQAARADRYLTQS